MSLRNPNPVAVVFAQHEAERARITLSGRLDVSTFRDAWSASVEPTIRKAPAELTVDLAGLTHCGGVAAGLFAELRRLALASKGTIRFTGVKPDHQRFVEMSVLEDPSASVLVAPSRGVDSTQHVRPARQRLARAYRSIAAAGGLVHGLGRAVARPQRCHFREAFRASRDATVKAIPVVALVALLVGAILAFHAASQPARVGDQSSIPAGVSVAVVREIGPLVTAALLAGRSGSALAAEIGAMRIADQLDALRVLGLEPVRFLVVPRVLAAIPLTSFLAILLILGCLVGAHAVMGGLDTSPHALADSFRGGATYRDALVGVVKSAVFGFILGGVGCIHGLFGKAAIGQCAARAAVVAFTLCVAADAGFGLLCHSLGV